MQYAELFCQSHFSFLQGASSPEELVIQAHFLGYNALALTDECSVAGVVRAHTVIRDRQLPLKLIIGSMFRMEGLQLVLLCPHRRAYAELCRIITNARKRAPKGEYQLSEWDLMSVKHCFCLWLPAGDESDHSWAEWLQTYHGGRLWIGAQRHLNGKDHLYQRHCQSLMNQHSLPVLACGGVLMHNATRLPLQHTLTAIRLGKPVTELGDQLLTNSESSLRSRHKLQHLFHPKWLQESVDLAKKCNFTLASLRYEYPSELIPEGETPMDYLRYLVEKGKEKRFPNGVPEEIQTTINKELTLIDELGYAYFFLTIEDIVNFARQQGILYQGRGSAANSVVCYCLGITSVDPLQISVLFERFISRERNEPPDIDVDFEHERREEVIQYIYKKYGRQRAALAATVITYRFKSAVRDVGKALGIEESQLDYFIRNVNRRDKGLNWQAQLSHLGLKSASPTGQRFIELVNDIMGFPRHLSQHVGGFVISSGPLYELVPVENAAMENRTVIQWDKDDLESLGLLKVDVLALGMLTAIQKSFRLIEKCYGQSPDIADITRWGDDRQVYAMIQQADTVGVFQIESRAQMSMLPRLKPATYYDLVIQIAIVRPGPIQGDMVHPFLKRRHGQEDIIYPSEAVREVLSRTMGVPIFQEQVIKLAMVAAGFTGGEADQLRRAMASWKKSGELRQFKSKLVKGMEQRGYETVFAERIYQQICGFGEYGFPESHSASFAVLAYTSAWLKYYYPAMFYASLLNSLPMGFYSASQLVQDAKRHGILILPVCINHSDYQHQVIKQEQQWGIRLGLCLVKGLRQESAEHLISARPQQGYEHISQLKHLGVSASDLQKLASASGLSSITENRYAARWSIMDTLDELPLFAGTEPKRPVSPFPCEPAPVDNLTEDYAALGLSLDFHPVTLLEQNGKLGKFTRMQQLPTLAHQSLVRVVGVVTGRQTPGTAMGVTFLTLEDDTGNINVVVWSGTARTQQQAYLSARILEVRGIVEKEGQVIHVVAGKLTDLSHLLTGLDSRSRNFH